MNNLEFISYKEYIDDPWVNAIATLRMIIPQTSGVHKVYYINYYQNKMKDGKMFWDVADKQVMKDGEKHRVKGFRPADEYEKDEIIEFIKENVKRVTSSQMPQSASLGSQQVYSQPQTYQPQQGTSRNEVAADEPLPF